MVDTADLFIREIQENELHALLDLYKDLNPNDLPLSMDDAQAIFQKLLQSSDTSIWVSVADKNKLVASCVSTIVPNLTRGGRPFAIIENVITKATYRKRGIGTRLLQHVISFAQEEHGCYKVMLQTGSDNASTHAFYKNIGFNSDEKVAYVIRDNVPKVTY